MSLIAIPTEHFPRGTKTLHTINAAVVKVRTIGAEVFIAHESGRRSAVNPSHGWIFMGFDVQFNIRRRPGAGEPLDERLCLNLRPAHR